MKTMREETRDYLDRAVPRLVSALRPDRIVLFGSFARGTESRKSDIDLFLVWETDLTPLDRIGRVLELLKDAPRPVEAIVYTKTELDRMQSSPFVRRILNEGEVLYESGKTAA